MTITDAPDIAQLAHSIARDVAAAHADDVDGRGRFPRETVAALADAKLLSCYVPVEEGGGGASLAEVAQSITAIGRECGSSAMVYAMHQSQAACLVLQGGTPYLASVRRRLSDEQLLLASATTEIGVGGDVRRSLCAVEDGPDGTFELVKKAPVISYADDADVIFVTARRTPDSPPNDQVLVVCEKSDLVLEKVSTWDTLGLRGTCSPGYLLTARATRDHIFPAEYADISARIMLPVAHILWAAAWLGIAEGAAAKARRYVREAARRAKGSTPPGALRLAELDVRLAAFRAHVAQAGHVFDNLDHGSSGATAVGLALDFNLLKVHASEAVVDIVTMAMRICGIDAYKLDSPWSLGRHLRDAHSAALMVNNDRILGNAASMELVHKGS